MSEVASPGDSGVETMVERSAAWRLRLSALWATRRRAALLMAVVGVVVYLGSLWNGFAYDDVAIIAGDPRVTHFRLLDIFRLPYWRHAPNLAIYRPLTTLSFAVDWFVSRGYPSYFHAINTLEHGLVAALVFLFLAELFRPSAAFFGALVFAVHPVHVEAVANVVGRAEVVSAIFFLAAILLWMRERPRSMPLRIALISVFYAIALLHKESSATLPAALVLVDAALGRWRLRLDALRGYVRRAGPLLLTLAVVLGAFIALRLAVLGRMAPSVLDPTFDRPMSAGTQRITSLQAWPQYARLLFFPRTLLADYSPRILMPAFGWNVTAVLGLAIVLLLVGGGLVALARGKGRTALGLLWFPLTILPVSNLLFPIGIIMAERTLYLPSLALCVGVAAAVERLGPASPRLRRPVGALAVVALAALVVRTIIRVPQWDSTNSIFLALAADRPDSFRANWHLARMARSEHRTELELRRYDRALQLWPYRQALVMEADKEAFAARRYAQARRIALWTVRHWPKDVNARRILAASSLSLGDTADARAAVAAGLTLSPRDSTLLDLRRRILPQTAVKGR